MKLTRRRRIEVLSMEKVVTAVEQTKPADLGIEVNGSSEKGHEVKLSRAGALSAVFGTGEQEQVTAFLSSHCLKVLKPDEASEDYPANDERMFLLSIIKDICAARSS